MNKKDFEIAIADVEQDLNKLKARYDQWIQGMERVPPTRQRDALDRRMRLLRRDQPNNTALKFKFQSVFARWTTLGTYWARITRQIEEGSFKRDIKRAKHRRQNRERQKRAPVTMRDEELDLSQGMGGDGGAEVHAALDALEQPFSRPSLLPAEPNVPGARKMGVFGPPPGGRSSRSVPPRRPPPPPPKRASQTKAGQPPPPRPARPPARPANAELSSGDMRRVYEKYVAARRRNNERVDNLSYDKLASRLRKMEPQLRKKHGTAIDFQVVMKNGRVGLKPVKKK